MQHGDGQVLDETTEKTHMLEGTDVCTDAQKFPQCPTSCVRFTHNFKKLIFYIKFIFQMTTLFQRIYAKVYCWIRIPYSFSDISFVLIFLSFSFAPKFLIFLYHCFTFVPRAPKDMAELLGRIYSLSICMR
jgi:hypothetical protein